MAVPRAWAAPDADDDGGEDEEVMEGDVANRKTVRLPDSLPELTHVAAQHFGRGHTVRMYHLGRKHKRLHHPLHIDWLSHDDFLVVEATGPPAEKQANISTHKADFVAKPLEKTEPFRQDRSSALSDWLSGPLSGASRYQEDYRPVPNSARGPAHKMPGALRSAREAPTGTTSYKDHYPWKTSSKDPAQKGSDSTLTSYQRTQPFAGKTSYTLDYPAHAVRRIPPVPAAEGQKPLPSTFQGESTYASDFLEPQEDTRMPSARPSNEATQDHRPLLGTSEYVDQYKKKDLLHPHIHLDPHTGRSIMRKSGGLKSK
mmetsp:Transcript_56432/g.132365  ORF Transcript_56432/g.132365 Transcript_56432/m.132365 type:complete len:314 (+) Transcript_56432:92-1033(+)